MTAAERDSQDRPWEQHEPGRIIGKGHPAGDFLEAWAWDVLSEAPGALRVEAHLPAHVRNPRGQLFGGFTPTYVDLVSLLAARSASDAGTPEHGSWLATSSMHVDYFEPILGPRFVLEATLERARGRTRFVRTRFVQDGALAVHALTTMRAVDLSGALGDA